MRYPRAFLLLHTFHLAHTETDGNGILPTNICSSKLYILYIAWYKRQYVDERVVEKGNAYVRILLLTAGSQSFAFVTRSILTDDTIASYSTINKYQSTTFFPI